MISLHPDFLTKPLAHRGLHGGKISENSRAAMMAAIEAGYGIELDLQLSGDDEAMVFHDHDMERLTGTAGAIRLADKNTLKTRLLGNGETVPTLAEILTLVAGRTPILVELKDQDGAFGPDIGLLEKRTAELVNAYDGPLAVMSYNPHSIYALQTHAPNVPRGLVTSLFPKENWGMVPKARLAELAGIPDFDPSGSCFITHEFNNLNTARVAEIKASGAPILCWTIRNAEQERTGRAGADNITFEGYLP